MATHPGVAEHPPMAIPPTPSKRKHRKPPSPVTSRLIDDMLGSYIDWRRDAAIAGEAYRSWSSAPAAEEPVRFSAYGAALDQEESSALRYAAVVADVDRALRSSGGIR